MAADRPEARRVRWVAAPTGVRSRREQARAPDHPQRHNRGETRLPEGVQRGGRAEGGPRSVRVQELQDEVADPGARVVLPGRRNDPAADLSQYRGPADG